MISIIAAIGKNRELGKNNKLLWHIPEDFKRFKNLTSGHTVIMGRKTYESLPEKFRPLPNRVNIILSRHSGEPTQSETPESLSDSGRASLVRMTLSIYCSSIEDALEKAKAFGKDIFIIGGASIYTQGIKYANKLYLTLVDKAYSDADAFFPAYGEFGKVVWEKNGVEGELKYRFMELIK